MATRERLRLAAQIALTTRHSGPGDPRLPALRSELTAATLEEHIKRAVDAAPPLTDAQRERLALLLAPGAG